MSHGESVPTILRRLKKRKLLKKKATPKEIESVKNYLKKRQEAQEKADTATAAAARQRRLQIFGY